MLEIITGADAPILRKKAESVQDPTADEIRQLIAEMVETLKASDNGVGLAAPQVGRSLRLFIAEVNGMISVFMNPEILSRSEESILFEEGCLSLPGTFLPVERAETVTLAYDDLHGTRQTLKAHGFLAILIQHETDHLDGILMTDRYGRQAVKNTYAL